MILRMAREPKRAREPWTLTSRPKQVILYSERVTDSMRRAMDETARRRARQVLQKSTIVNFHHPKLTVLVKICLAKLTVLVKTVMLSPFLLVVYLVTDSMRRAMDETARRRARQVRRMLTESSTYASQRGQKH